MNLIEKVEVYSFDLSEVALDLPSDLSPNEEKVDICFKNGEFVRVEYNFDTPYSERKWEIMSLINAKIKELKEYYREHPLIT